MTAAVEVNRQELIEFCRRNSVRRLALFGSVLTERFSEFSDVDVLVEFQMGTRVGRPNVIQCSVVGQFGALWGGQFCPQPAFSRL